MLYLKAWVLRTQVLGIYDELSALKEQASQAEQRTKSIALQEQAIAHSQQLAKEGNEAEVKLAYYLEAFVLVGCALS